MRLARKILVYGRAAACLAGVWLAGGVSAEGKTGEQIYVNMCASCHGPKGEGVADKYDEPLYGDKSVEALARVIARTMPEDAPGTCTGEDADKVAQYIFESFYSPSARARNKPARVELARLTNTQYENAIADLAAHFTGGLQESFVPGGLSAEYFNSRNFRDERKVIERTDAAVNFSFGTETPDAERFTTNEYAIRWRGSIKVEETGDYEFSLLTENGARLWVNDDRKPLIDAWVSSGTEPREHKESIRLLGGPVYPIRVEFFRFSEKTGSIKLQWRPPHGVWEVIPDRNLAVKGAREALVITTPFPADDSSVGYERGTAVSKEWDQATTHAAVETVGRIMDQLEAFSGVSKNADDRKAKLQEFCAKFAQRAFRRPLDEETRKLYVERQFADAPDLDASVKRSLLLILKSPRFLYPELPAGPGPDAYDTATRLALTLWDSLPDQNLLTAAAEGKLSKPEEISAQAERMLRSPKAKAKINAFFHHWLEMEEGMDMSKDKGAFPDFSDTLLADLRTSLELFIHKVVWSEASDYRELLLADYLLVNERLSKFYGIGSVKGDRFAKVKADGKERAGVITHPYLLSTFAYHKSTSPIHRGVFLTRNIVGRALKPPPMAIQFMDGRFDPTLTMREKVTELTSSENCMSCHSVINPLGFSLESFDGVGRFRTTDNNKPVDTVSDYLESDGKTVRFTGARDVAEYAAKSEAAQRGFVQQMFHHVVKQPAAAYGSDTIDKLRAEFEKSKFNIQKLVVEIVKVAAQPALAGSEKTEEQKLAQKGN